MALHLIKLCVGVESIDELETHVENRLARARRGGLSTEYTHTTRMTPTRVDDIIDGGSLYWVIKGQVQVRQPIMAIRPFTDGEGIKRCHIVLQPVLVRTVWQPRRAFQGWRYFKAEDAPADIPDSASGEEPFPPDLRRELMELGLL
ncbi:DUF1489 family protein [Aurantimonas sp. C2-6-R+9]|uniref:DUF1489 family protein n=1 Tax=unclassified Aurantimonas TaxID=2638230 RepID=UPI002E188EAD|nr:MULTISPECIES: DUF1489 family protein [unclassified Aurantimonas]MEC5290460.1 DUF1489 family protein [Aurantimonas sp. C2-3-R2]MEC5380532.1 DUF1489 family protein [Aurantimonas sp. C2-6-R+9]MEC5411628.1 DUF1489 family protein [Aurantimonas sp. C2-4-R8]